MMRWMKGCHDFIENEECHDMYVYGGLVRRRDSIILSAMVYGIDSLILLSRGVWDIYTRATGSLFFFLRIVCAI